MHKLSLAMRNCYGIPSLRHEFTCERGDVFLIYAPNGAMKTSFAKAFEDLASGRAPKDCIFRDRESSFEVTADDAGPLNPARVLVVKPYEEQYSSERVGTLMVNQELRTEYERLVDEVDGVQQDLLKGLSEVSGISVRSIAKTLIADEGNGSSDISVVLSALAESVAASDDPGFGDVPHGLVFNKQALDFLRKPETRQQLAEYITRYDQLLSTSRFFRSGGFNVDGAKSVGKSLSNSRFFEADHKLVLADRESNETPVNSAEDLDALVAEEKRVILGDEELIARFGVIDDAMAANEQLRQLRAYLEHHRELLPELVDPESFRSRVWLSYGYCVFERVEAFLATQRRVRPQLVRLVDAAREQETEWRTVVDAFHERFKMPFVMRVENQDEVILQEKMPSLLFDYCDGREMCEVERGTLIQALSTGERRALYLLNVIFEITSLANDSERSVLVLDDVADSFDYKNKYAIIEYLMSIRDSGLFVMFLLTHNFDFFRTVRSRLGVSRNGNCLMAVRSDEEIELVPAQHLNPFDAWRTRLAEDRFMVAAIPMIRNLIEYARGMDDDGYGLLTALLHQKDETASITREQLSEVFAGVVAAPPPAGSERVVDIIYAEADRCCNEPDDPIDLANKVVLSIAIRLRAESFMVSGITDTGAISGIRSNQTRRLYELWKADQDRGADEVRLLDRVLLMTPEAIHLNSFMYEPILDMSSAELAQLYGAITELGR